MCMLYYIWCGYLYCRHVSLAWLMWRATMELQCVTTHSYIHTEIICVDVYLYYVLRWIYTGFIIHDNRPKATCMWWLCWYILVKMLFQIQIQIDVCVCGIEYRGFNTYRAHVRSVPTTRCVYWSSESFTLVRFKCISMYYNIFYLLLGTQQSMWIWGLTQMSKHIPWTFKSQIFPNHFECKHLLVLRYLAI